MQQEPQAEHKWLEKFVGEWTSEADCNMGPDQPPMKMRGTESVRSIGGMWIMGEGKGEMPGGGAATMMLTVGYDPEKRRYIGTWIGSMMTHLWIYDGEVDASGKILTLNAEGPNMATPGTTAKYQDITEFKSDDHRVMRSQMLGPDGKWVPFMEAHYHRVK